MYTCMQLKQFYINLTYKAKEPTRPFYIVNKDQWADEAISRLVST